MTSGRPALIAGNWKMNGPRAALAEVAAVVEGARALGGRADLLLCPPATLLAAAAEAARGSGLLVGAQDVHPEGEGARTGDLAATMLRDAGASHVIVGHSERRQPVAEGGHGEGDALVRAKALAARAGGLVPIVCVGETFAEREAGRAVAVVEAQVAGSVPTGEGAVIVAYEPVWAIGTGRTPTPEDIAAMHAALRAALARLLGDDAAGAARVLYGGSVKPSNAAAILALPHVDGALVGGASLKAVDFLSIATAAPG